MNKPISTNPVADLPVNWTTGQIVSPSGTDVGLTAKHGYNYLGTKVNEALADIGTLNDAFAGIEVTADGFSGVLPLSKGGTGKNASSISDLLTYLGLNNVNNTSDANKPISTATQTALNAKQATITGGATTIVSSNLTASKALVSDSSGKVAASSVTSTELGYLSGVTSAIQTQLNSKQASGSYKSTQTAVSDPTASGTSLTFIKTITQNAQGVITPTKATVGTMGAASSSAAGSAGLVPAPAKGKQTSFLRGDGTWVVPDNTTYSNATTSAAGLMSATDKSKLDGIAAGANAYSLPTASASTLGGIKVGTNLSISNGVLSATNTTYSAATTSAAGLMSAADKTKLNGIATGANAYSLPTASASTLGGIKIGTGLSINSSGVVSAVAVFG